MRQVSRKRRRSIPILAVLASAYLAGTTAQAGCPNFYGKLDEQAERAVERFNAADRSRACSRAEDLLRVEQRLSRFVQDYQVQCVIDQEIIDVQTRRVRKAREAQSLRIPTKSPRRTDMKSPVDSETMSPTFPI